MASSSPLPVLGIDPGQRWTAGVLRVGDFAAGGWTVGPVDAAGNVDRLALDNPDNLVALTRYISRVLTYVDATFDQAIQEYGRCRVAVEEIRVPVGYRYGKPARVALVDWLVPRSVVVGVLTQYPDAVLVPPGNAGRANRMTYPADLQRRRPPHWGVNDTPKNERDHERAAYDVAGYAAATPERVAQ